MATITGTPYNDTLYGTLENDSIDGLGGHDILYGDAGNDTLIGGYGNDQLYGQDDNDILYGNAGSDYLEGGAGDDTLIGGDGNDGIYGQDGNDILNGNAGKDTLDGGDGNDTLDGGTGADALSGGAGNDVFKVSAAEAEFDSFYDADGNDKIVLRTGAHVTLDSFSAGGWWNGIEEWNGQYGSTNYGIYGNAGNNWLDFSNTKLVNVSFVDGGEGDDTILGANASNDTLRGGDGNDILYGRAGFDSLSGGDGNDQLFGEDGNDTLNGDSGNDTLYSGTGNDILDGGTGADVLSGDQGDDTFRVSATEAEFDAFYGGDGYDKIVLRTGADVVLNAFSPGGPWQVWNGVEEWNGRYGGSNYGIYGNADGNWLDFTNTKLVNVSFVNGGDGNDTIWGANTSNDTLLGAAGNDLLYGNTGNDLLDGGTGTDTLSGGLGDDTFRVYAAEAEFDTFDGGDGYDKIVLREGAHVTLNTFSSGNGIEEWNGQYGGTNYGVYGNADNNLLDFVNTQLVNVSFIDGGEGNDTIGGGGTTDDTLLGAAGNDVLYGNGGNDLLDGGMGADALSGGLGDDTFKVYATEAEFDAFDGGDGYDRIVLRDGAHVTLNSFSAGGWNGVEEWNGQYAGTNYGIYGNAGDNSLDFTNTELINVSFVDGGDGNDIVIGADSSNDNLLGGDGNDWLYGRSGADSLSGGYGNDQIFGEVGNDSLDGNSGNDNLDGGNGNDTLDGGAGTDTLSGGIGADLFKVSAAEAEFDSFNGGDGYDKVVLRDGADVTLNSWGANGIEEWNGQYGATKYGIYGNVGDNTLDFSTTKLVNVSFVDGGNGNDTIMGAGASNDSLRGGQGNDLLYGRAGNDNLNGGTGNDGLYGEDGKDILNGNSGNDYLDGGTGNDTLDGGTGIDTLIGGLGDDTFKVYATEAEFDSLAGGDGYDKIVLRGGAHLTLDSFSAGNGIEELNGQYAGVNYGIYGNTDNNLLDFTNTKLINVSFVDGGGGDDTIRGDDSSNDTLLGGLDYDVLSGNAGDDVLNGNAGNDDLTGNAGSDTFVFDALTNGEIEIDVITDYSLIQGDRIDLPNALGSVASDALVDGVWQLNLVGDGDIIHLPGVVDVGGDGHIIDDVLIV